jgi:hypothetical protein
MVVDMDEHMQRWAWESTEPTDWDIWVTRVESMLGHDLDGSFRQDGYSLDHAWGMYREGLTPDQAVARIEHDKKFAPYDGR